MRCIRWVYVVKLRKAAREGDELVLPEWFSAVVLSATFLLAGACGVDAFHRHRRESAKVVSPRKWMYWLFSAVFLVAAVANLLQLSVMLAFRGYGQSSCYVGYFTLLLMLCYGVFHAGVKHGTFR